MFRRFFRNAGVALAAAASLALFAPAAQAQTEQQKLVADAEKVLANFLRDPDMGYLQRNISRSKALIIAPEILKAGFMVVGDHKDAREARRVFEYYGDLVSEIQLVTRLDGTDIRRGTRPTPCSAGALAPAIFQSR